MTGSREQIASARRSSALRFIVYLGVVSLFADMTYEGAHSIIGPFLRDLGASPFAVALIAGARAGAGRAAFRSHAGRRPRMGIRSAFHHGIRPVR
jgi:hypothetical protein